MVSPIQAKWQRIEWAKAYIMFCREMGWMDENEEWALLRNLPTSPLDSQERF